MLAQPVPAKVERDHAHAFEQGNHAQPVPEVAGQPVKQENRLALTGIGVSEPLRMAILRQRKRYVPIGPSRASSVPPQGFGRLKWTTR